MGDTRSTWIACVALGIAVSCSSVVKRTDGSDSDDEVGGAGGADGAGGSAPVSRCGLSSSATSLSQYECCLDFKDEASCLSQGCAWRDVLFHTAAECDDPKIVSICTFTDASFGGGFDFTYGRHVAPEGVYVTGLEFGPVAGFDYCWSTSSDYCDGCGLQ